MKKFTKFKRPKSMIKPIVFFFLNFSNDRTFIVTNLSAEEEDFK
jgi:hypothetical protein